MSLREIWKYITTTRYARALEAQLARERAETDRLRAENRALLNSILGIAGIPPLPAPPPDAPASGGFVGRSFSSDIAAVPFGKALAPEAPANGAKPSGAARLAAPMRRRSWQQINRLLEFESARKQNSS
jgi:hypothetical protein